MQQFIKPPCLHFLLCYLKAEGQCVSLCVSWFKKRAILENLKAFCATGSYCAFCWPHQNKAVHKPTLTLISEFVLDRPFGYSKGSKSAGN